jgi:prepilin-type N-terminal cleavage/methylation domain-containing protein
MTSRRAFTLVELLVVIAIIAVLISMVLGTIHYIRPLLTKMECASNLHNCHQVIAAYSGSYGGRLPIFTGQLITERKDSNPYGGRSMDRHFLIEALKNAGAQPKLFCCPAHPYYPAYKEGASEYVKWEPGYWKGSGSRGIAYNKAYETPGYTWFTYSTHYAEHPFNGSPMPSAWRTWSRFANGSLLPQRLDQQGDPPMGACVILWDRDGNTFNGCWHDGDRETPGGARKPNPDEDLEVEFQDKATSFTFDGSVDECVELGGGGHTLFVGGEVVWAEAYDLVDQGPGYIGQSNKWYYFIPVFEDHK